MLTQNTLTTLKTLRLEGMARAFEEQLQNAQAQALSFEERIAMLVDREATHRDSERVSRLLKGARLKVGSAAIEDIDYRTGGPARYVRVQETGGRLGFITPLTHNFCESCNRVRVTCTGTLFMCLGQEDAADLRTPLRASESDDALDAAIEEAISRKPKGHDFIIDRRHKRPALARHMSVTGG